MTDRAAGAVTPLLDGWLASCAAGALGVAGFLGLAATLSASVPVAIAAGVLGGTALTLLVAAGWVAPLPVLALSLPLPALFASDTARLPPALLVSAVLVGAWVLGRGVDGSATGVRPRSLVPLGLLVAAMGVSALFAESRVAAAREVVNFALLLGLACVTLDAAQRGRQAARTAVATVGAAAAVAGTVAVAEMLGAGSGRFPLPGSGLVRAAGGFGWPNELGMFLAIAFPLAVYGVRVSRGAPRAAWVAACALVALGLGATYSRGSWLSVASAPVALLFVGERRIVFRFWIGGLLAALLFDVASGGALVARIAGTTGDVLVAQRLLLSGAGLLMFQAHPIVGVGPGGFGDALEQFGPQVAGLFDFVGSAHNGYVHVAAEAGILGLVALLAFLTTTWWRLRGSARARPRGSGDRALAVALLWSFTTACLVSLFEWPFAHGVGELIVLVAALGLARADGAAADR